MGTILAPHQAHYRPEPLPVQAAYGAGLPKLLPDSAALPTIRGIQTGHLGGGIS